MPSSDVPTGRPRQPTPVRPARVHFADSEATEMRLERPEPCPAFPGLTLDGLAAAPGSRHYLIVTLTRPDTPAVHAHLGPDPDTLVRNGFLLVAGLTAHGDLGGGLVDGAAILAWLADCWTAMVTEVDLAAAASPGSLR